MKKRSKSDLGLEELENLGSYKSRAYYIRIAEKWQIANEYHNFLCYIKLLINSSYIQSQIGKFLSFPSNGRQADFISIRLS